MSDKVSGAQANYEFVANALREALVKMVKDRKPQTVSDVREYHEVMDRCMDAEIQARSFEFAVEEANTPDKGYE